MKKRNLIRIEGTAEALEPIIHGGDKTGGTITEFRREKIKLPDGEFEFLPVVVTANSVAGVLRDLAAFWCLDQINFDRFDDLRAFDLLTGGGSLTKANGSKKTYVDLAEENDLRELFPVISLMGGSVGNRIIGGRIDVDNWLVICHETKRRLNDEYHELAGRYHIEDLLDIHQNTRRDDKKNREFEVYLNPDVLRKWQTEQEQRSKDDEANERGDSQQMRYGHEVLSSGTVFQVGYTLRNTTPIEQGVFFGALTYFYERPKIGGRGSRGFGKVKLDLKQYQMTGPVKIENPMALETMEQASEFLKQNEARFLEAVKGGAL